MRKKEFLRTISMCCIFFLLASALYGCKKNDTVSSNNEQTKASSGSTSRKTSTASTSKNQNSTTAANASEKSTVSTNNEEQANSGSSEDASKSEDKTGFENSEPEQNPGANIPSVSVSSQEEKIDFGGRKIIIAGAVAFKTKEDGPPEENPEPYKREYIEQKFNCKIEQKFVPSSSIVNEFINSMLAGVWFSDVLDISTQSIFPNIVNRGFITPIDKYIDFDNHPYFGMTFQKSVGYWLGKHYGLSKSTGAPKFVTLYNREIFERDGLPDLHQFVNEGNWNWETLVDIAVRATKDFNGDGIIDQWGLVAGKNRLGQILLLSNGQQYFKEVDGKY